MKADSLRAAQGWLNILKDDPTNFEVWIKHLRQEMKKGKLTFADLGTSSREIKQLRQKDWRLNIQRELCILRSAVRNDSEYSQGFSRLKFLLKSSKLSLADIGVTEEEFESFRVQDWKVNALMVLANLRDNYYIRNEADYQAAVNDIKSSLEMGNLSLQDIGTTEKELKALRPVHLKLRKNRDEKSLRKWLKDLRSGHFPRRIKGLIVDQILAEAKENGLKLEDIGTSSDELNKYRDIPAHFKRPSVKK